MLASEFEQPVPKPRSNNYPTHHLKRSEKSNVLIYQSSKRQSVTFENKVYYQGKPREIIRTDDLLKCPKRIALNGMFRAGNQ
jgi:hypothetical protein